MTPIGYMGYTENSLPHAMLVVYGSGPARASEIVVMVMTVFAGIAEFKHSIILERTGRGREAAMRGGVDFGPGRRISSQRMETARGRLDKGHAADQAGEAVGMSRSSVYRLVVPQ